MLVSKSLTSVLRKGTIYHLIKIGEAGTWKVISACRQDIPHSKLLLATIEINQAAIVFGKTSIEPFHQAQRICDPELRTSAKHILHAPTEVRRKRNVFLVWLTKVLPICGLHVKCKVTLTTVTYIWDIDYTTRGSPPTLYYTPDVSPPPQSPLRVYLELK